MSAVWAGIGSFTGAVIGGWVVSKWLDRQAKRRMAEFERLFDDR